MKKTKLHRVNIIKGKSEDHKNIIQQWSPVLESAGILRDQHEEFHDSMALYCHMHALLESQSQASMVRTEPSLPIILSMVRDMDMVQDMRIEVINAPNYIMLIGDKQYFDTIETIDVDYEIPAFTVPKTDTNIFEIYQDRMVEHFQNTLEHYIDSVPNADTLVVFNLGEIFMTNEVGSETMQPTNKIWYRFRIRAFEDATYVLKSTTHKNEPAVSTNIEELGLEKSDDRPASPVWSFKLDKEPSNFKQWLAKILFGRKFAKTESSSKIT